MYVPYRLEITADTAVELRDLVADYVELNAAPLADVVVPSPGAPVVLPGTVAVVGQPGAVAAPALPGLAGVPSGELPDPTEAAAGPDAAAVTGAAATPAGAAAPILPDPTASTAAPAAELDSEGVPWNAEFHTAKRSKLANETWRLKRIDKDAKEATTAAYAAWKSSYLAAHPAPAAGPATAGTPAAAPGTGGPLDAALASGAIAGAPAEISNDPVAKCLRLMTKLYEGRDPNGIATIGAAITQVCSIQGLASSNELVTRPDLAPTIFAGLQEVARQHGIVDASAAL